MAKTATARGSLRGPQGSGGVAGIAVQPNAPSSPAVSAGWLDSDDVQGSSAGASPAISGVNTTSNPGPSATTGYLGNALALVADASFPRGYRAQVTFTGPYSTSAASPFKTGIAAGSPYSATVMVWASRQQTLRVSIAMWQNGAFVQDAGAKTVTVPAGMAALVNLNVAALPGGTWNQVNVNVDAPNAANGDLVAIGAVRTAPVDDSGLSYADGATAGWSWAGAAGLSESAAAATGSPLRPLYVWDGFTWLQVADPRVNALLTTTGLIQPAKLPAVLSSIRSGSVAASLTSDASAGGNLINLTLTGNPTLNLSAPTDHQRITYHLLASGAARTVTLGTSILTAPGEQRVFTIPQNTVLSIDVEYIGNRPTPAWLVIRARWSDVADRNPVGLIARHRRTGNATGTTSAVSGAQPVARIPASVLAGRCYRIRVDGLIISTAASNAAGMQLTYTTDGSNPGIGSTALEVGYFSTGPIAQVSQQFTFHALYVPSTSHTLTALLSYWRQSGSGTITMQASASTPLDITVEDLGPDTGGADGVNL